MANAADEVGLRRAAQQFGWGRDTIRKGCRERDSGVGCVDAFNARGTKPLEQTRPQLIADIRDVAESFAQTDPRFKSGERYLRLSVESIVWLLIDDKGYQDRELPSNEAILVEFADKHHVNVRLAYYPPYHSKYNAVQRCWAAASAAHYF